MIDYTAYNYLEQCIIIWNEDSEIEFLNAASEDIFRDKNDSNNDTKHLIKKWFTEKQKEYNTDNIIELLIYLNNTILKHPNDRRRKICLHYIEIEVEQKKKYLCCIKDISIIDNILKKQYKRKIQNETNKKNFQLAAISHELFTPLHSIMGFGQLFKRHYFDQIQLKKNDIIDYIQNILDSADRLQFTLKEIIEYSKIELGDIRLNYSKFIVHELIISIMNLFKDKYKKKNIKSDIIIHNSDAILTADREKFRKILEAILDNSFKFTQAGGKIRIKQRIFNEKLYIDIVDNGIGIEKDNLKKIFRKFTQIETHLSRQYEGIGMGLGIAKKYVNLHGGRINFRSKKKVGSICSFYLPLNGKKKRNEM